VERLAAPPETGETTPETSEEESAREELAAHLTVPKEPRAFSMVVWLILLFIPVVNVLSLFVAPLKLGLRLFMGAAGLAWIGAIVWYAAGTFADPFAAEDAVMMTGFTTILLYFIALFHSWRAARRDARTRLPAWRASVERWDHLRWCDACRAVYFDDRPDESAGVQESAAFLGAPGEPSPSVAPTPLWLWIVLAAVTVGGGKLAVSAAGRVDRVQGEETPTATPALWEDIEPDPVLLDSDGATDSAGLDEPLLAPDTVAPD